MAMGIADRLLTVAVTATLTSAAWIVAGSWPSAGGDQPESLAPGSLADEPLAADGTMPAADMAATATADNRPGLAWERAPERAPPAAGELTVPVAGVTGEQLADTYRDPRGGDERLHEAIDIMAPAGTGVIAAAAGTVERLHRSEAGGNTIYLRSDDRRMNHYYAHLADYAPGLHEGQRVRRGQRLGSVGSSGNASAEAPHLHFAILRTNADAEWWEPAAAVNPYPLLAGRQAARP